MSDTPSAPELSAPAPAPASAWVPALDGLRGVAVLLVVLFHTGMTPGRWTTSMVRWSRGGWLGVDLFFALSGYLITRGLLETRDEPRFFQRFWWRRVLRIFPLYYLYLAVLFLAPLAAAVAVPDDLRAYFLLYLGNVPESIGRDPGAFAKILWSLAVEEHFYLLWPLIVRFAPPRRLLHWCAGGFVLAAVSRAVALEFVSHSAAHLLTPCRIDALLGGAAVSILARTHSDATVARVCREHLPLAVAVLLFVGLVGFGAIHDVRRVSLPFTVFGMWAVAAACAVCVGAVGYGAPPSRWLGARFLTHTGKVSYGVYLWHGLVAYLLRIPFGPLLPADAPKEIWTVVLMLTSVLAATLSYALFEAPILSLKGRFLGRAGSVER